MPLLLEALLAPHAPAILPEVNGRGCESLIEWAPTVRPDAGTLIVVSPHGAGEGVYASARGDLKGAGIPGIGVAPPLERDLAERIADGWGTGLLDRPLDPGAVVPLAFLGWDGPTVALSLAGAERSSIEKLAVVLDEVLPEDATLLLGAHGSAALASGAPYTELEEGHLLQQRIDTALAKDVGTLIGIDDELWTSGKSCSRPVFELLGRMFPGSRVDLDVSIEPFGVAYRAGRLMR